MFNALKKFLRHEEGAITVDWVVLTAGVVILGTIVGVSISQATADGGTNISQAIADNAS